MHSANTAVSPAPSLRDALIALSTSAIAGVALWVSRGSLDIAGTASAPERVAMLPSWSELAGLIILALLITSAIASLLQRRSPEPERAAFWSPTLSDTLMPLFGLTFVVLPYLPFLADWIPALRILAGPLRTVIWAVVIGQVLWVLVPRVIRLGPLEERSRRGVLFPLVIAAANFVLSVVILSRLAGTEHFTASALARVGYSEMLVWVLMAVTAAAAAVMWAWARALTGSPAAATAAWAAVCLAPPFALNTLAVYPEAPLALGVLVASGVTWRYRERMPSWALYVLAFVVSLATWMFLTGADTSRFETGALPVGMAGLLFDQEYGLAAYAPALLLGIAGLAAMAGHTATRSTAWHIIVVALPFVVLAACIDPWWSKSSMPGRLILPVFPLLGVPIAWSYQRVSGRPGARAAIQLLILIGVVLTLTIAAALDRAPFPQEADGSSSLLQWLSHGWQLWADAPSFVASDATASAIRTALWIALLIIFIWLCRGTSPHGVGRAALQAAVYAAVLWLVGVSVSAAIPAGGRESRFDPEGRVIFPLLETFDPVARPLAVRYNPLSFVTPQALPPLFSLTAVPGQRRDPQPVRVVLNARFRLPAGEYVVDVLGSERAGKIPDATLALQLGRDGGPVETWPLALASGTRWQRRFQVPLDSEFVGFRASRQVQDTIAALRLTPVNVVEIRRRFPAPVIRSAASYASATVFFHDAESYPEREGLWVKGQSVTRMTVAKKVPSNPAVMLAIHSGARANVATLSTGRWTEIVELVPGVTNRISVPSDATQQFIPLTVTTNDGFVPADVEPGSRDRRLLGVWISFIPDDTSRTSGAP